MPSIWVRIGLPLVGYLLILAALYWLVESDVAREVMGEDRWLYAYILLLLAGVWGALSAPRHSYAGIGVGCFLAVALSVGLMFTLVMHDRAVESRHRSEGGEFYMLIADVLAAILMLIGFVIGRGLQALGAWSLRSGARLSENEE